MGGITSHQIPPPPVVPFTSKNYAAHLCHARKMYNRTMMARRKVWESLQAPRNHNKVPIDFAKHAHLLAEATRQHFEHLVANYPSETEVWTLFASFHELIHDESGAEECQKRLAYLHQSAVVSDTGKIIRQKTKEEEQAEKEVEGKVRDSAPYEFLCPITLELMRSPVTAADGFTYEESAITEWLEKHNRSPLTNLEMESKLLTRNEVLDAQIKKFLSQ